MRETVDIRIGAPAGRRSIIPSFHRSNIPASRRAALAAIIRLFPTVFLAFAALLTSSCATIDAVTGQKVYNLHSLDQDVALGRQTIQANIKQAEESGMSLNADPQRVAQLNDMTRRIADASDMPQLPYEVTLFHTNIVNAAAAPGGSLMVFEGLYDTEEGLVQNEDELAAVMAHEIAHVNCRHGTEELSKLIT
ncbi:MAG: M48 family metalloprotease, partial [Kiritimatiellae bacterium]|nr:M48 family metalloprotease [Kiritimatiellia bacterium]